MGWITGTKRLPTRCSLRATWIRRWRTALSSMYVNERTLSYGEDGKAAIRKLLEMGHERGIIPMASKVEFIG